MSPVRRLLLHVTIVTVLSLGIPGAAFPESSHRECRVRICDAEPDRFTVEDVEAEVQVGREVAARVLGRLPLSKDVALNRYVSLVGRAVALHASRSEIRYHFAVVESETVNAYSTPGGYVFVTRGALDAMRDEAELAGVMGHEISHVCARHLVKELDIRAIQADVMGSLVNLLSAGAGSATVAFRQAVEGALDILFEQGYRIEDEREADRGAVFLAASAGYDPSALARFLERLNDGRVGAEVKAYPATAERVEDVNRLAEAEAFGLDSKRLTERFEAHAKIR